MDVYAIWKLDEDTNRKLDNIREALDVFNIQYEAIYGHITFASFLNVNVDELIEYSQEFAQGLESFEINCSAIGFLSSNCIACIPSTSGRLLKYYQEYHKKFDSYCNIWTSKEAGLWLPHISLYFSYTEDLGPIFVEMMKQFSQFKGRVIGMEICIRDEKGFNRIFNKDLI